MSWRCFRYGVRVYRNFLQTVGYFQGFALLQTIYLDNVLKIRETLTFRNFVVAMTMKWSGFAMGKHYTHCFVFFCFFFSTKDSLPWTKAGVRDLKHLS